MKAILLAGGHGSRLFPTTSFISKHLIQVYDKPMIYYSLCTVMLSGIREILIISSDEYIPMYKQLLGDGSRLGLSISYKAQINPNGIAEALVIGEGFIGDDAFQLVLGDNFFYGAGLSSVFSSAVSETFNATILASSVNNPENFGVCCFDEDGTLTNLVEKPREFLSPWAITGCYFFCNHAVEIAKSLKPSARNELEITELCQILLEEGRLRAQKLDRGVTWLDLGTPGSILKAGEFISSVQYRQNRRICCPEEVAMQLGYISKEEFAKLVNGYPASSYTAYLKGLLL